MSQHKELRACCCEVARISPFLAVHTLFYHKNAPGPFYQNQSINATTVTATIAATAFVHCNQQWCQIIAATAIMAALVAAAFVH
jgi:hypothetical protein